jgi:lysozyme
MQINESGLKLIKGYEGLRLTAYVCPAGVNTIGYGHTGGVKLGTEITEQQAEDYLRKDISEFEKTVNSDIVKVPLNENQFSALVSFSFNVGSYAFIDSTLLKLLNKKDYQGAADQLLRWNKGDGDQVLAGLTRRRKAERALFLGKEWNIY